MKKTPLLWVVVLFCCIAQSYGQTQKKIKFSFSTAMIMRIVDQSINDGEKTDNSIPEKDKTITIASEFNPIILNGNLFSGIAYSYPHFDYKEVIKMNGEFSPDKKAIKWLKIKYKKTHFAGDPEIPMYSTDETYFNFEVRDIPLSYGNQYSMSGDGSKVTIEKYEKLYFGQSTHNRVEVYEEYLVRPVVRPSSVVGAIFLNDVTTAAEKEFSVRISHMNKKASEEEKIQEKGLAAFLTAELSSIPGIVVYEGMYNDVLQAEAALSTSGLVSQETAIDAEVQKYMLEMKVDMAVFISVKTATDQPGTYICTITYTASEKMLTFNHTIKSGTDYTVFIDRVFTSMAHTIKNMRENN
ncbi:MAG TPA: hypothetical protein PKW80_03170 [Bacteroidales bacterium]|nr:hypothetical protein [Bacteroidales bacterium]